MYTFKTIIDNLQIPQYHVQNAPPTPPNTLVNNNETWNKLIYPPINNCINRYNPPFPNYETIITFFKQWCSHSILLSFSPQRTRSNGYSQRPLTLIVLSLGSYTITTSLIARSESFEFFSGLALRRVLALARFRLEVALFPFFLCN